MRILVTRTDRLGDVILATPVLRHLRQAHPDAEIHFLVQKAWMPILAYSNFIRLIPYDPASNAAALASQLRPFHFDVAYVLKDDPVVSKAVHAARIPVRIGPYSSLRSLFYFNAGRLQRRSRCLMHEAEYNLDLVTPWTPAREAAALPRAWISIAPEAQERGQSFLAKHQLGTGDFFVVHPGSSGSSRYVHPDKIHYFAQRLMQRGHRVVVSGGPNEIELLKKFRERAQGVIPLSPAEGLELDGMAEVYRHSKGVVAHGTGPLHLAAAVGAPVLGIFPPLFVLSETRWGPLTPKRKVWVPAVSCPEKYRCRGERCREFDCMDLFDVETAVQLAEALPT